MSTGEIAALASIALDNFDHCYASDMASLQTMGLAVKLPGGQQRHHNYRLTKRGKTMLSVFCGTPITLER
jgi:hypothetical protein